MSFLGAKQNFNAIAPSTSKASLDTLKLYYDDETIIQSTEEYDLYLVGNICTNLDQQQIEKSLENAEGTFAYVLFLKHKKETVIGTDKMGFFPLYYTDNEHNFIFANFIPHIKHRLKKAEPNWDTWDELLNTGDILGHKSTIKGVSRLRQGEKLSFIKDAYSIKTFWRYEGIDFVGPEDYINLNNDLMCESMEVLSANNAKKIFPLTGGHDSRRIAITAKSLGIDITAITQEVFNQDLLDEDTLIASLIAKELDIKEHIKLPQPDVKTQSEDMIYKDYWCGYESSQHAWAVNIAKNLKKNSLIYDGCIGDITINNHYFHEKTEYLDCYSDINKTTLLVAPTQRKYMLKNHLTTSSLQDRIRAELKKNPLDCNQITLFKIFNHARRNTSQWYTPFLLKGINVNLPYGYSPLFLQSLSLGIKYRLDALYQHECMLKINKAVAGIPSTRENHDARFWIGLGARKGNATPFYPCGIVASDRVFSYLQQNLKNKILDGIFLRAAPDYIQSSRSWYYEPLQRLNLFLEWLETDENHLPVLYKGKPPFIEMATKGVFDK